ncbi:MBL fold metallo-hydrolase [Roseovarius sp. 10]|uniref:MBL fold metallo-hydrolase n=1 Tax=Roseovarius sp. 10 TaxID=3080563 RepID=UPI002953BDFF|nr:MBL fold metallo-hydrolase [Roseovarius sp. 10]MDV7201640.1 MBL fold metallo-hydrolase [Roseovarius sp. 10]
MIHYPHETPPAKGTAREIADGILWIRLSMPLGLDHVNVYALREPNGWTVIDTGLDTKLNRREWAAIIKDDLRGDPILRVVVTHHHPDHVGLAGWFMAQGAELLMTRTAWLTARMLTLDEEPTPSPEAVSFWRAAGMDEALLSKRLDNRPFNFCDTVYPLPLGFTRLEEGAVHRLGGRDWVVHLGQGHAPDHATLWCQDVPLVLAGDQLLPSISPNLGVYPTEPMADPVAEWLESCARFETMAREDHLVLPGHKLPYHGLPARLAQLSDNHHGALARLREHLRAEPRTAVDCFAPLFKRQIDEATYGLAMVEAVAHLNHLYHLGEVAREMDARGAWVWQLRS